MRRFTGFLAIIATLLSLASAQAQKTYTQSVPFSTSNQSMWKPNQTSDGYIYDFDVSNSWEYHGYASKYDHVKLLGTFGGSASFDTKGSAGLRFHAYATSGRVDVNYPGTLTLTYPDPSTLAPGQTFTVKSSWALDSTAAEMQTHSPDAGVSLGAFVKSDPMRIHLQAEVFSHNLINNDVLNTTIDFDKTLLDTHNLTQGSYVLIKPNILSVDYHQPHIETKGVSRFGLPELFSSGGDQFLYVNADFTNALAAALDLPPMTFNGHWYEGFRYANATVDWSFLDLQGDVPVSLQQHFYFNGTPMVTLNLSSGSPVTFQAGTSVHLTMPADGSPLTITPTVTLDNQFQNRTDVNVGASLEFTPADFRFRVHIDDIWTHHYHFQPVPTIVYGANLLTVPVYNQEFTLGGFSPQTLPAFTLTRVDTTPLVANDDSYTFPVYTMDVTASTGVLLNDTGPSGFHAVVATLTNDVAKLYLQSDGSFHFATPDTSGPHQYNFSYQITDDQGHFATANISVTVGGGG